MVQTADKIFRSGCLTTAFSLLFLRYALRSVAATRHTMQRLERESTMGCTARILAMLPRAEHLPRCGIEGSVGRAGYAVFPYGQGTAGLGPTTVLEGNMFFEHLRSLKPSRAVRMSVIGSPHRTCRTMEFARLEFALNCAHSALVGSTRCSVGDLP